MDQLEIRDRGIGGGEGVNHVENAVNRQKNKAAAPVFDAIARELCALDPNAVTPLEALALISEWKKRLARRRGDAKPRDTIPSLFDD
jgi:hypothetical protein